MRFFLLALLLASPLCFAKTVVVIQSYHLGYQWDANYIDAVQSVLGDDHDNAFSLMASHLVERQIPVVFLGVNGGSVQHPTLEHELVAESVFSAHEQYDAIVVGTHAQSHRWGHQQRA